MGTPDADISISTKIRIAALGVDRNGKPNQGLNNHTIVVIATLLL
jgi:hypothetical protein